MGFAARGNRVSARERAGMLRQPRCTKQFSSDWRLLDDGLVGTANEEGAERHVVIIR